MNSKAVLISLLGFWAAAGVAQDLPLPPRFTLDLVPEEGLRAYPLGSLTEVAARSHHGAPDQETTLPNGLEGWVYRVYPKGLDETYVEPGGDVKRVQEREGYAPEFRYTLVFGADGKVIDVLYAERSPRRGMSALLLQYQGAGD